MKKLILIFQILIFLSQSVRADDGLSLATQPVPAVEVSKAVVPQMPKNYKLPDMHLLDSVAFYNRYKDQQGRRLDVKGYAGRFGVTFGDEFKQKIYDIQRESGEKIEIILTLSSTREDAKVLKQWLALSNREAVIVEIPDHIQAEILAKAEAQAAGGFKELWWDTKDKFGKLLNIKETIVESKKIIKNQFVKPSKSDIGLVYVSASATVATTAILLTVGNVDPGLALTIAAMRLIVGGSTLVFHRTITNFFRFNVTDELAVKSSLKQTIQKLTVLGLGLGEFYYLLGSHLAGPSYGLTQKQLLINTYTSGFVETAASTERTNRLSINANYRMIIYSILLGAGISTASMTGQVGPLIYDNGFIEISTLQLGTLAVYSGLFLSFKYFTNRVEKIGQHDLLEIAKQKWQRLKSLRKAREERLVNERLESAAKKQRLNELLAEVKMRRINSTQKTPIPTKSPMCSLLFQ